MVPVHVLLEIPKTLILPARTRAKSNVVQQEIDIELATIDTDIGGTLVVYVRCNARLAESFSMGLRFESPGARPAMLIRVNGTHGRHRNSDGTFVTGPHLHMLPYGHLYNAPSPDVTPEYAVDLPATFTTVRLAWPTFREVTGIVDDAKFRAVLSKMSGGEQGSLFDE